MNPKHNTLRAYLSKVPGTLRRRAKRAYRALGGTLPTNDEQRELLAQAVFDVENDLEHRLPRHPAVIALNDSRNAIYDDLRWNEAAKHHG